MESPTRRTLFPDQADLLRQIPSVDELLTQPRLASLAKRVDRALLLEVTRATLADLRAEPAGDPTSTSPQLRRALESTSHKR